MWSKCADADCYMTFVVCISAAKSVAPPLFLFPGKRLNCDVFKANITAALKGFINSILFLRWLELFANSLTEEVGTRTQSMKFLHMHCVRVRIRRENRRTAVSHQT